MLIETSFGIIPLKKQQDTQDIWSVLLINHHKGSYWSFPKGHQERGESNQQTARRELKEETGLNIVKFLSEQMISESYIFYRAHQKIHKHVHYFLAEVEGQVILQLEEVKASQWIRLEEAEKQLTFLGSKLVLEKVQALLS